MGHDASITQWFAWFVAWNCPGGALPLQVPQVGSPPLPPGQGTPLRRGGLLPGRGALPDGGAGPTGESPEQRDPFGYPEADRVVLSSDGTLTATGHVVFRWKGNLLRCDRLVWRRDGGSVEADGSLELESDRLVVRARRVLASVRSTDFVAEAGSALVPGDRIGTLQDVRVEAGRLRRTGDVLRAEDGWITSCDLDRPHARVGFGRAEIHLGKRLVVRDATAYSFDQPVARIRHLAVPLDERRGSRLLPTVGRTNEEGVFVKAALGYALSPVLPGLMRIDLMERKGIGLGFDQTYRSTATEGTGLLYAGRANFYSLRDQNRGVANTNGRLEHEQRVGRFDLRWTADRSSNSYQAALANSTVRSSSVALGYAGRNPSSLTLATSGGDTGFSRNSNRSATFAQSATWGSRGKATLRLVRNENETQTGSLAAPVAVGSLRETADLVANWNVGRFDAQFQANRNLSNRTTGGASSGAFFAGTERLPDLRLSMRQPPRAVAGWLGNLTLGYGRFLENAILGGVRTPLDTDRLLFQMGFRPVDTPLRAGWRFRSDNRFQQTVYDGYAAAQYLLEHGSGFERPTGRTGSFSVNYRYLRPYGGTPVGFRLDQSGGGNSISTAWNIETERNRVSFGTAYDIQRARASPFPGFPRQPWSNVQLAIAHVGSARFMNRFQCAYDPNQGKLLNV
ncbi:MAG: hypothetical protein ACKO5K_15740, partial [Armatimonadota bacterium]